MLLSPGLLLGCSGIPESSPVASPKPLRGTPVFELEASWPAPPEDEQTGWGGPETSDTWMTDPEPGHPYPAGTTAEHGMFVDDENNVWVAGNGHVALKFSPRGELLLQIGERDHTNGSSDPARHRRSVSQRIQARSFSMSATT